jgi:hypothetical protein
VAGRLAAVEKVQRDSEVVADRVRGLRWATIAQRHALSERHCREIVQRWHQTRPGLGDRDPLEAVAEVLEQLEGVIERLSLLADQPVQDSVRLGALKALLAAQHERVELLMSVGLLPRDLGLVRHEIDIRRLTRTVMDVFDRHGVASDVRMDVAEALRAGRVLQPSANGHQ